MEYPHSPRSVAAAVLAGGAASRMGGGKAGALLAGHPLVSYPVEALREAGLEPFVVTKSDRPVGGLPGLDDVQVFLEPDEPRHPLLGVLTALERAGGRDVIVLACDLPLLTPALLQGLAVKATGTTVPRAAGQLQPLAARYAGEAIEPVRRGIAAERSVTEVIRELSPVILEEDRLRTFGDPGRMFENVNTPEDLLRVETLIRP